MFFPPDFVRCHGRDLTPYDVVATTDVTLCTFSKSAFEKLIGESPRIEAHLLSMSSTSWMRRVTG